MLVFQRVIGFEPSSRVKIAFGNSEHAAEECVYNLICLPRVSPVGEPWFTGSMGLLWATTKYEMSIGVDVLWILQNMFLLTVYITAYSTYACNCIYIIIQLCAKCK